MPYRLSFTPFHNDWRLMVRMKPPDQIETERLVLRKPHMEDTLAIYNGWTQDKNVTRYLTWRPHQCIEQTKTFIQHCRSMWESETRFPYIIMLKMSSEVIGIIDPRVEGANVGIGYVMARAYWGNGYLPEATKAIIDWALHQPSIYRVYATIDVENGNSRRVLEKAGMQCEGILRKFIIHPNISDQPRDSYIYAIRK